MIGPAKIYFIIFGLLTIIGGVIGYASKGSMASIVAGSISGILLLVGAFVLPNNTTAGLAIAGIVSILLAGRFIPAFVKTGDFMPAGMMAFLSAIGVIVAIAAFMRR
ncbi:MAG TPA: TMEM14 family protein [Chthoniobacterales bacterium]|nr:TMEM14 family protein [Chthoniobacterales bacterium]